ncbi:MAG: PSD1 and planctomycete cytochrome C domain-containing protein [Verrucomicrobiales bacterium]
MKPTLSPLTALLLGLLGLWPAFSAEQPPVSFSKDIRPILSDKCFSCHGRDVKQRKAELRLDTPEGAYGKTESGAVAIVPGDLKKSEVWARINSTDKDDMMPPPKSHKVLTTAQRDLLGRWIAEGARYEPHWAFVPVQKPALPEIRSPQTEIRNPIDRFILARLEQEGLSPSPEVERTTLIRRVTLDLTGLPPTVADVDAFLADSSPDAYERVVDRLMATRDYAERRAQDWLDLARYADTRGFADDKTRDIWPFREWVIAAIQSNQPFDRFTIEQLAGDMLPDATTDQRIASAFHRNAPQAKGNTYPVEEYRLKGVVDRVNTTGTVWLGLTVGCAECHDHKFDPLSQSDYYRLFALFNNIEHSGEAFAQGGPHLEVELADKTKVTVPVMKERVQPRETFIHERGNFLTRGEMVSPGVPAFLLGESAQPGNRLEFARWLVNGKNPLVARVVVNRFWQGYFGHGLVRTVADFGLQGESPTHPELLDRLASEFVASGWDMKAMHRLIVTSATYRQSTRIAPHLAARDPQNRWLASMPRVRLPAEQIRDQALTLGGLLKPAGIGRSVFPPQPDGYWEDRDLPGKWTASSGDDLHRKSLYIYWRRMALHPTMELLDAPPRAVCTARRNTSNVPTQALVTLNDPLFVEAASAFARRILSEATEDNAARLEFAFRLCLSRQPDDEERGQFLAFIDGQTKHHANDLPAAWTSVATVLMNLDETLNRP